MVSNRGVAGTVALLTSCFVLGVPAQASDPGSSCVPVRATIEAFFVDGPCDSPVGLCTEGTVTSPLGLLSGTTRFVATGLGGEPVGEDSIVTPPAEPATTWAYSGVLTLRTAVGTLSFEDVGVLDTVAGTFTELERPLSGTGLYRGFSGALFISGYVKPDGSGFDGDIRGDLCVAKRW
jgi:hypothetical protein